MSQAIILYCRGGFEKECAAEIEKFATLQQCFGYARTKDGRAFVEFHPYNSEDAEKLYLSLELNDFVFARHWFLAHSYLELEESDRLADIIPAAAQIGPCQSMRLEFADSNDGKQMSSFCKKFERPLKKALNGQNLIIEDANAPNLQLFFISGTRLWIGLDLPGKGNPNHNGILRLRQPSKAPSRSTLKLDEAFQTMLSEQESERYVQSGMRAVDLGACPGGWTYQLVRRSMMVEAVDNGPMQEELMMSGQVKHWRADGFKYQPMHGNNQWLVCDMVEKPVRVTYLALNWFEQRWCRYAIFNLKLPMKKRFFEVEKDLDILREGLSNISDDFILRARHLYHDREEVTVFVAINNYRKK
ncbi:23S rRNA (cytidine(2498)-2'-O)-methyltransferase RlmM [Alginatibacterium sediminis]|uniref:23S rRNA (Cytidine(2498)-2'-O)-methyltransferase RlmM n=1 Tax=Alginatibacterium sediminis TaxID=2164068 RepID=A0A420E815_9ALTE|nr:23S rRNA (cytidine(2498)-2'-O)-methyltransferase RlmM [Alginatibacterium sediminis]RKF15551.1 23S rRNA (cytidine(2498)-2'-O)-methyltransferase RlmM [Alginatibacterium sediminis]